MWALLSRHASTSGALRTAAREALLASLWCKPVVPTTSTYPARWKDSHNLSRLATHLLWVVLIAEQFQGVDASIKRPLQALRTDELPIASSMLAAAVAE